EAPQAAGHCADGNVFREPNWDMPACRDARRRVSRSAHANVHGRRFAPGWWIEREQSDPKRQLSRRRLARSIFSNLDIRARKLAERQRARGREEARTARTISNPLASGKELAHSFSLGALQSE